MKGKTKAQKGITLIALIITIVVLLILTAVAISSIVNEDLIAHTENTAAKYNGSVTNEQGTLVGYENYLNKHVGGLVGDEVTMLNGDGQSYYTLAPSTLSFRSSADINDFQEVQINGETLDQSNYTVTEGSTIINLSIDYLKTLGEADYSISIVSKTGSTNAGFSVVKPDLNEHGFYYGQPYYAYIEDSNYGYAFMMHENGMANIFIISITMESMECQYSVEGNTIILHTAQGDIVCNLSDDNKSIYCAYIDTTLTLGNVEIVADEEYLYRYSEYWGGYEARAIDKSKKNYAPIKSNIYGMDIVSLEGAFYNCVNMVEAPKIPDGVKYMGDAYRRLCVAYYSASNS